MKRSYVPYLLLIPFFINFAVFFIYSFSFGFFMSFTNWNPLNPIDKLRFWGLKNYVNALNDKVFLLSLKNAFVWMLNIPACLSMAFVLALALNSAIKGRTAFRTLYFIPYITSIIAISYVWGWLYGYDNGPFNYVLVNLLGLPRQNWLGIASWPLVVQAQWSIQFMSIWQWTGYNAIIFVAGLQAIPKELYEAARISGANAWNCFRHVTVPLLKPTILFVMVTAMAGCLQVFTEVAMMTQGGPMNLTMVPVVWMVTKLLGPPPDYGYASAMAFMLFLITLGISLVTMRLLRRGGMVYY